MRIALLTDAWLPQVNGVVTTLVELVRELEDAGHDVHVLHPGQFATRPCPGYAGIDLAVRPYKLLAKRLDTLQPDAIHLATEGPLGWAGRRYCLKRGLAFTTEGADAVVNQLVTLAGQGLQQVAANASRFEEKTGLTLDRLSLVATPVAAAAVKLVGQIEQKSGELASKIAGDSVLPKRTSAFRKSKKK